MASTYSVLRALEGWTYHSPLPLSGGVWVKPAPLGAIKELGTWGTWLSGREVESLRTADTWLRTNFADEPTLNSELKNRAIDLIHNTAIALQVAAPVGSSNSTIILCQRTQNGWIPRTVIRDQPLHTVDWARGIGYSGVQRKLLKAIVRGGQIAFRQKTPRVINALFFLEFGLQSSNILVRHLFWTSGLDSLLMAGNATKFVRRLKRFLGADAYVFPGDPSIGQPIYRVGDVAADIYELRSLIAHGRDIPDKFRKDVGLRDENGNLLGVYTAEFTRAELLQECALFLLCHALRRVFLEGLLDKARAENTWRQVLDS